MARMSAGLVAFRRTPGGIEVLLVHPGGPFWTRRDRGVWSIPKGEYEAREDPLSAAVREFGEETGFAPREPFLELGQTRQSGGKVVTAWAFEGDYDAAAIRSNTFSLEYPPRSGRFRQFPEVDRAAWFTLQAAAEKIVGAQAVFLARLAAQARAC